MPYCTHNNLQFVC